MLLSAARLAARQAVWRRTAVRCSTHDRALVDLDRLVSFTYRSVATLESTRRGPAHAAAPAMAEAQIERTIGRARILEELQAFNLGDLGLVPLDAVDEPDEDPSALMLGALA